MVGLGARRSVVCVRAADDAAGGPTDVRAFAFSAFDLDGDGDPPPDAEFEALRVAIFMEEGDSSVRDLTIEFEGEPTFEDFPDDPQPGDVAEPTGESDGTLWKLTAIASSSSGTTIDGVTIVGAGIGIRTIGLGVRRRTAEVDVRSFMNVFSNIAVSNFRRRGLRLGGNDATVTGRNFTGRNYAFKKIDDDGKVETVNSGDPFYPRGHPQEGEPVDRESAGIFFEGNANTVFCAQLGACDHGAICDDGLNWLRGPYVEGLATSGLWVRRGTLFFDGVCVQAPVVVEEQDGAVLHTVEGGGGKKAVAWQRKAHDFERGLRAYYPLIEGQGTTLRDRSGNGFHATPALIPVPEPPEDPPGTTAVQWESGPWGGAVRLSSGLALLLPPRVLDPTQPWTVAYLVQPSPADSDAVPPPSTLVGGSTLFGLKRGEEALRLKATGIGRRLSNRRLDADPVTVTDPQTPAGGRISGEHVGPDRWAWFFATYNPEETAEIEDPSTGTTITVSGIVRTIAPGRSRWNPSAFAALPFTSATADDGLVITLKDPRNDLAFASIAVWQRQLTIVEALEWGNYPGVWLPPLALLAGRPVQHTFQVPALSPGDVHTEPVHLPGAALGDECSLAVVPPTFPPAALVFTVPVVSAADTVRISVLNVGPATGPVDLGVRLRLRRG